jgi:hypothetical protein
MSIVLQVRLPKKETVRENYRSGNCNLRTVEPNRPTKTLVRNFAYANWLININAQPQGPAAQILNTSTPPSRTIESLLRSSKTDNQRVLKNSHFEAHPKILKKCTIGLPKVRLPLQIDAIEPGRRPLVDLLSRKIPVRTRMVGLLKLPVAIRACRASRHRHQCVPPLSPPATSSSFTNPSAASLQQGPTILLLSPSPSRTPSVYGLALALQHRERCFVLRYSPPLTLPRVTVSLSRDELPLIYLREIIH